MQVRNVQVSNMLLACAKKKKNKKSNDNTIVKLILDAPNLSRIKFFYVLCLKGMNVSKIIARSMRSIIVSNIGRKTIKLLP